MSLTKEMITNEQINQLKEDENPFDVIATSELLIIANLLFNNSFNRKPNAIEAIETAKLIIQTTRFNELQRRGA